MITIRKSSERGHAQHGWLDSFHTFSFADYYDPKHTSFRALRVINEDRVDAGEGFGTHGHRNMEIITVVVDGELTHKDSMGNTETLRPGQVQATTAGRGIRHSEENKSEKPVHFLQIWIEPSKQNVEPRYATGDFGEKSRDRLALVASPDGRDESLTIEQDARIFFGQLSAGRSERVELAGGERHGWVQVVKGSVTVNGTKVESGDGVAVSGAEALAVEAQTEASVIAFDLP